MSTPAPFLPPISPSPPLRLADGKRSGPVLPIYFWALLALVLLLAYNAIFSPSFFRVHMENGRLVGNSINILLYGSKVMLISLGMTLVIATGGIDLSVGAIMAIAGGVSALLICDRNLVTNQPVTPLPLWLAILGGLGAGLAAGIWNGVLIGFVKIQPIIATLILMISGRGVAIFLTHGQAPTITHAGFLNIALGVVFGIPFPIILVALVSIGTMLLVRTSALGMFLEAIGNNSAASEIAGINTRLVKLLAYGFIGLCSGLAGVVDAALNRIGDTNQSGLDIELDAIVAVAIGGTSLVGGRFSLLGSLIGAIVMQSLKVTIQSSSVKPEYNFVVQALVISAICLLQSPKMRTVLRRRKRSS